MRILQINAVYALGSTGFYTRKMHEMLLENGHESYVICSNMPQDIKKTDNIIQVGSTASVKFNAMWARLSGVQAHGAYKTTACVIEQIKEIAPDVIHLGNLHANFINIRSLLEFIAENDIPLVVTLHDCWFFTGKCVYFSDVNCNKWQTSCGHCPKLKKDIPSWFFDRTDKMLAEKADLFRKIKRVTVVGVSERITADAKQSVVFKDKNCTCISNAIDENIYFPGNNEYFPPENSEMRRLAVLGAASRWSTFKGIDDFIYLANYLHKNFEGEVKISLAGSTRDLSDEKQNELFDCGIEMLGLKSADEMAELYRNADVFVSASKAESFGCTIAEAVMCGTPVVTYDGYAEREISGQNGCGFCVPAGEVEQLASAVAKVLGVGKDAYYENLTIAAERYKLSTYFSKYCKIYEEFL